MRKDIDLVVGPETALTFSISKHKLESHPSIIQLRKMQQEFNRLNILIGATTWRKLDQKEVSKLVGMIENQKLIMKCIIPYYLFLNMEK